VVGEIGDSGVTADGLALTEIAPEEVTGEVGPTLDGSMADLADLMAEFVVECPPGAGCFGDPCATGEDCWSGICADHLGGSVCSDHCVEECPPGWTCRETGSGGPDVMWICVSEFRTLCRPCVTDADCLGGASGQPDVCLDYGAEGRFCGGVCSEEKPCPQGYDCLEPESGAGAGTLQCMAAGGACSCSAKSVELGLATVCESTNGFGTCQGARVCTEEGLTECDAPAPMSETCNGADDNCDGQVDEETCDDGNECTEDSCAGQAGCMQDPLSGINCDDGDVCTVTDHCDDGTCKGSPINCNDSNPCTDDTCDGVEGCVFESNLEPCDDGDPCTIGDSCSQGTCSGVPVNCDCTSDEDCLQYEDDDLCNGTLFCDLSGVQFQ